MEELVEATKLTVRETGLPACYIRPIAYYGYGEMGLNTMPCSVDVAIACWPWGAYLGEDALTKGVRMKITLVDPPRPQHHAARRQDHRQLRQLVARQGRGAEGRLRRGDHAQPAGPRVASARARTSSSPATARSSRPPLTSGALEGITQSSVMTIAARPRLSTCASASWPQRPVHRRRDVRVRHGGRGQRR